MGPAGARREGAVMSARAKMSLPEAKRIVRASLRVLEDLARGFRGKVKPQTKEAFRIVLKAVR